jgi:hypothetical protein
MLHLFTATKNVLRSAFGRTFCMTLEFCLTCYPHGSTRRFTGVSAGNATRIAGGNPLGTQEKHVFPTRRGCVSLSTSGPRISHRQLQRSLDWTGRVCGLAFQVTGPHTIGFLPTGLHDNLDLLIVRRF